MFRYVPTPIRIDNFTMPNETPVYLTPRLDKLHLAVTNNQLEFMELDDHELNACMKTPTIHYCRGANVFDKRVLKE